MIDHMGVSVKDYAASKRFYTAALAPLGVFEMMEVTPEQNATGFACGFGAEHNPFFWIGEGVTTDEGIHIAFTAKTRDQVDAFYSTAMQAGATDNGAPGIREQYHPNYYAAFVRDPNGFNVEAVCHTPE